MDTQMNTDTIILITVFITLGLPFVVVVWTVAFMLIDETFFRGSLSNKFYKWINR